MSDQLSVAATREEQIDVVEDAFELVEEDVQKGRVDARTWAGDVTDGEKLRILSAAYCGRLEFDGGEEA